ncbi:hypothetical protein RBSWK_06131 [Rhodopirellula baltica SWK14]|uniref:Uncharacterized protein n=1 Tax=Rhodopirellula baltica SWK14 TaxID=993516 RepID=L7C7Q5_RHOBT|nr:hypothetical protein RBSWK_06131 [Rhodopirellula baltica SWK14]
MARTIAGRLGCDHRVFLREKIDQPLLAIGLVRTKHRLESL